MIMFAPGECCDCGGCPMVFDVTGCRSVKLPGALCSVWTDSSKTTFVGSATTDSAGAATVPVPGAGSYYSEISHSRFATNTGTSTVACPAGTTRTVTLSPATGYHCIPLGTACALPAADTLYLVTSFGNATLTYNAAGTGGGGPDWLGGVDVDYPGGCGTCTSYPGAGAAPIPYTVRVTFVFRGLSPVFFYRRHIASFRSSWGISANCPKPDAIVASTEQVTATVAMPTFTCPAALLASGTYSFACFPPTTSGTWSLTE